MGIFLSLLSNNSLSSLAQQIVKPIRIITGLGLFVAFISFIAVIWFAVGAIIGNTVPGWASTTCIIAMLGGIQLIGMLATAGWTAVTVTITFLLFCY